MTNTEKLQIRALDRCRFGHREFDQRFCRHLATMLRRKVAPPLSNYQRFALGKIVYRYRRQLAERLPADMILQQEPKPEDYGLAGEPSLIGDLFSGELSPPHEASDHVRPRIHSTR